MTSDKSHLDSPLSAIELDTPQPPPKLPPLRLFVVHRQPSASMLERNKYAPLEGVMVEAHGLDTRDGCLLFFVLISEPIEQEWAVVQYTRRIFKKWSDVEEITGAHPRTVN